MSPGYPYYVVPSNPNYGQGKLTTCAQLGLIWAADSYQYSPPGTDYGAFHVEQTGFDPAGFNIVFFDGSVRWVVNKNHFLANGVAPLHENIDNVNEFFGPYGSNPSFGPYTSGNLP